MRFTFLVLISLLNSSLIIANNYRLCTLECSGIDLAFADALTLPAECQENENNPEENSEVSAAVCLVEYQINYRYERIRISFGRSNDTDKYHSHGNHQQLEQTISFSLQPEFEDHDSTTRRYSCNNKNDCAKDFYLNTIGPLLADGKNKITLIKNKLYNRSLLMGSQSKRRCIDSDKTGAKPSVLCRTGLCQALFVRHHHRHEHQHHQNENKTQKCDEYGSAYLRSENEYHLTDATAHIQKEFLEYRCNKNICNRNDMIEITHGLLSEFSHLPTTEKDMPMDSQQAAGKHGEHGIETKTSSSTSIQSSLILVLFYLLLQKICF